MSKPLRVLNIEDSERDFKLLIRHLSNSGYEIISERVETPAAMKTALENQEWNVILSDYSMPHFSALEALELLKETKLDIPFIIISGTIGEEIAVKAIIAGANDYLMKDNLTRLVPAIERELQEVKNRETQRQSEIALRQSQEQYRHLLDTANEGVLITSSDLRIVYGNQQLFEMFGYAEAEVIGHPVSQFLEDASEIGRRLKQRIEGVKEQYDLQLRRKNGTTLWVIVNSSPIHNENGEFTGILSMLTDISIRKNTEEQLIQSEARYRLLFESNPHPMWVYDPETLAFLEVNDAAVNTYGYSRDEFLTMTIKDIRPSEDLPKFLDQLSENFSEYKTAEVWEHQKKDGTIFEVEITAHEFIFNQKTVRLVLAQDVTEKRNLEDQLRQSQKMEAVGQLAGGVAHDFNNMLTVINGYCHLISMQLSPNDPLLSKVEEINKAGERAASLTRQLLIFSRKQILQPKILDLNLIISEIEKMLRRLIGENIEFRTILDSQVGSVKADPGQIEQTILNLVVNARDAMPEGGKLLIETKNIYLDEDYVSQHIGVKSGYYIMLAVSDSGIGMDAETQSHIFEPFYTTKEVGRGTGLGLSTVYGIVRQSGGSIWVYSEPGKGTTFKVYLPRVDEIPQAHKSTTANNLLMNGTETILLVEDEKMVRKITCEILESCGYEVFEAENGSAAFLLYQKHKQNIQLLITDVILPEMNGSEIANRLLQINPELKVLYMSGYTDNAIVNQGIFNEGINFIEKPFSPDKLRQKVRDILDGNLK